MNVFDHKYLHIYFFIFFKWAPRNRTMGKNVQIFQGFKHSLKKHAESGLLKPHDSAVQKLIITLLKYIYLTFFF